MANYPQLDDCSGVWTLKEVNDAVMGGYWRQAGSRALFAGGQTPTSSDVIDYVTIASTGDAADFGDLTLARIQIIGTSQSHGGLNDGYQGTRPTPPGSGRCYLEVVILLVTLQCQQSKLLMLLL